MFKRIKTAALIATAMAVSGTQAWALGGGRLAATQAINGLATEVSGPLAYSLSLIAIVGSAVSWYRHHHEMGALSQGVMGVGFVGGIAMGATSLMGFIPGVAGALI
jgi:hypothetical protein